MSDSTVSKDEAIRARYATARDEIFSIAEQYVAAGLQIVPVHSALCINKIKRGKAPSLAGWQKEPLAWAPLKAELERLYNTEGGANIGLKTGGRSGIVCVDVDSKNGSPGIAWYLENEMHLGSPIIERTSGEGLHLYYRFPTGCGQLMTRSSAKRIFRGVDILADGAGQVVTFPSIHATSGEQYRFDNSLSLLDVAHEADELPEWIVSEILLSMQNDLARDKSDSTVATGEPAQDIDLHAARLHLLDFPPAVQGNGGDMVTLRAAMQLKDFGLNESQVLQLLWEGYNPKCQPPWTQSELRQKVTNAFRYGRLSKGVRSVSGAFSEVTSDTVMPEVTPVDSSVIYSRKSSVHNAKVFCKLHKGKIRCFSGEAVVYDERNLRWQFMTDQQLESAIYKDIARQAKDGPLIKQMRVGAIADVRKIVKYELNENTSVPEPHWISGSRVGSDYITTENGILDVREMELLPHSPDWFSFQSINMRYDPHARCDMFQAFLNQIWDQDEELIESLRLWIGYCLLTQANLQRFAIFKGASRAGKSTLMAVIDSLVGEDNAASTSLSMIGSDFGLQSLVGKRIVTFQDADRASADRMGIATERIKSLASNDVMAINRKNQSVLMQRLGIKVNFVCNQVPQFLNAESAMTKRMLVFPFWKSFEGSEDLELAERLRNERAGIFNWALVGARRILDGHRLATSSRGEDALRDVQRQLDSVLAFCDDCVRAGQDHNFVTTDQMWSSYRAWCADSGRTPKNRQRFLSEMARVPVMASNRCRIRDQRGYRGIVIVSDSSGGLPFSDSIVGSTSVVQDNDDDCPF